VAGAWSLMRDWLSWCGGRRSAHAVGFRRLVLPLFSLYLTMVVLRSEGMVLTFGFRSNGAGVVTRSSELHSRRQLLACRLSWPSGGRPIRRQLLPASQQPPGGGPLQSSMRRSPSSRSQVVLSPEPMKTAAPSAPFALAVVEDPMAFYNFYVGFFM
jgi:hypothetical protein